MEPNPSRPSRGLRLALAASFVLLAFAAMPMPTAEAGTFDFCKPPAVGVIYQGAPLCITPTVPPVPSVGVCSYGVYVGTVRVCQSLPSPSINDCNPPYTVGVKVDGIGICQPVPTVPSVTLCPAGYTGVQVGATPVCQPTPVVGTCNPPATVGATVNGIGACQTVPTAGLCPYGYGVRVDSTYVCQSIPPVGLCGSGHGVYVGSTSVCQPTPTASACDPLNYWVGVVVNGAGACVDVASPVNSIIAGSWPTADPTAENPWVRPCVNYVCAKVTLVPGEGKACVDTSTCAGSAEMADLAADTDSDGYTTLDELLGNSDPTNPASRPWTDDDCDGRQNQHEVDWLSAQGIGHPVVGVTQGEVEFDPETLEFEVHPPHVSMHQEGSSAC